MKVTITETREQCDLPGCTNHASHRTCDFCNLQLCYDHKREHIKEMPGRVYTNSSEDLQVCESCRGNKSVLTHPKYLAFNRVGLLRAELKAWSTEFEARAEVAQAHAETFKRHR